MSRPATVLLIGHRGCAEQYPENTVAAFRRAAPHVDALEVDVQRCGSGELVAFHDEDLERITGCEGRLATTPWERLADLEVLDSAEPIPRFETVVDAWPDGVTMNLDVHDPDVVPDALEIASDLDERILLSSTSTDALATARETDTSATLGYSFHDDLERNVGRATELGCEFVHVPATLCTETAVVAMAHDAGLSVDAWTIGTPDEASRVTACDVDAMTVDRWDIL